MYLISQHPSLLESHDQTDTRSQSWLASLGSRGSYSEKTERESRHMSLRACCQVCASQDHNCRLCCQCVSVGSESPGARTLQGAPQVPAARPSSLFLHREEVAVQRRGVTAGAEVHS